MLVVVGVEGAEYGKDASRGRGCGIMLEVLLEEGGDLEGAGDFWWAGAGIKGGFGIEMGAGG